MIVRGSVRFGGRQSIELATSLLEQGGGVVTAAAGRAVGTAVTDRRRDQAVADADVAVKREGLLTAVEDERLAVIRRNELPVDAPPIVTGPEDTRTLRAITASARAEARRRRTVVNRLSAKSGIQVPADEIIFLPDLPVRVDEVKAKRGSTVSGPALTVTSARLIVDSSLDVSDAKLVRVGDPVTIEEQDLGVKAHGRVAELDRTPGTRKVDPNRFYFSVAPTTQAQSLVGASVRLTIAVKSTRGAVLAVPVSALSVGGDGSSRLQVRRGGRTELVTVVPGLAAEGFVEVRPVFRAVRAQLTSGRYFDAGHSRRADRVLVLGPNAALRLGIDRVDQQPAAFLGDRLYAVIGLLSGVRRQASLRGAAIMPEGTARREFGLRRPRSPRSRRASAL